MTFEALQEHLARSDGPANRELEDLKAGRVAALPGPGNEAARTLRSTFTIRAKTSAAAGIGTLGLEATLEQLIALPPEERVVLFPFSGATRIFTVFVKEL